MQRDEAMRKFISNVESTPEVIPFILLSVKVIMLNSVYSSWNDCLRICLARVISGKTVSIYLGTGTRSWTPQGELKSGFCLFVIPIWLFYVNYNIVYVCYFSINCFVYNLVRKVHEWKECRCVLDRRSTASIRKNQIWCNVYRIKSTSRLGSRGSQRKRNNSGMYNINRA